MQRTRSTNAGFTLVEILVVVAIIGVLTAVLAPAIFNGLVTARQRAVKLEVAGIEDAINKYKDKFGDYPPDGSSWAVFERHCRSAYPNILASELALLNPANYGSNLVYHAQQAVPVRNDYEACGASAATDFRVMDPAEALVFFLGGMSSDPQRPFTGPGGPLSTYGAADGNGNFLLQANSSRQNAFYEFEAGRLSLEAITTPNGDVITVSTDETLLGQTDAQESNNNVLNDLFPVYLNGPTNTPITYFDARTYQFNKSGEWYFNRTLTFQDGRFDSARPYLSDEFDTQDPSISPPPSKYSNPNTFQIVHSGLDGWHDGYLNPAQDNAAAPVPPFDPGPVVLFKYPSNDAVIRSKLPGPFASRYGTDATTAVSRLRYPANPDRTTDQEDNITNFSTATMIEALAQ